MFNLKKIGWKCFSDATSYFYQERFEKNEI